MKPYPNNTPEEEPKEARKAELERLIHHKTVQALRELDALIEGHLQASDSTGAEEESTETDEDVEQ
jgi:hypothetical protein